MTRKEFLKYWSEANKNLGLISIEAAYSLGSTLSEITQLLDERSVEACFDEEIEAGYETFELAEVLDVTSSSPELLEFLIEGCRRGFWGWKIEDNNIMWVSLKI